MAPTDTAQLTQWRGQDLVDPDRSKIGTISDIYFDEDTGAPEWIAVSTGMFGTKVSFVPLRGATPEGNDLMCRWTKQQVKDAPRADADGQLSQEEEAVLYQHYGLAHDERTSDPGLPAGGADQGASTVPTTPSAGIGQRNGGDTSADPAMTRSEEEMRVGTRTQEAGRARLRKWVETEHAAEDVQLHHDEVRVEREPITDANRAEAMDGPEISEAEYEVTLFEEKATVDTVTVPKERVRLDTEVVADQERVEGEVRKEHIEVEGAAQTDPSTRRS
jgi:uncharacterized protein (TIGR02271 family)